MRNNLWKRSFAVVLVAALLMMVGAVAAQEATPEPTPEATPDDTELSELDAQGAFLGVLLSDTDEGATVEDVVVGSPAAVAGIRPGDVIIAVNDAPTTDVQSIVDVLAGFTPGDAVTVTTTYRGVERTFDVTLGEQPRDVTPRGFGQGTQRGQGGNLPFQFEFRGDGVNFAYSQDGWEILELTEDSTLYEAGLREGDVITAFDGEPYDPPQLLEYLVQQGEDTIITLTVERDGETQEIELPAREVSVIVLPLGDGLLDQLPPGFEFRAAPLSGVRLGVTFTMLNAETAESMEIEQTEGALITQVLPDSPADEAGLQANDVITAVDGTTLTDDYTLRDAVLDAEAGTELNLSVIRDGETMDLSVTLSEPTVLMPGMPFGEGFRFEIPMPGDQGGDDTAPNV